VSRLYCFTFRKEKRYPLNRKQDGPPGRSECVRKISAAFNTFSSSTKKILQFLADDVNKFKFLARSQNRERRLLGFMSVRPSAWNNSATTGRILIKFDTGAYFAKFVEKIQVPSISDKSNWYFTWRPIHIYERTSLTSA